MYYLLSRYYDPAVGRFINADSLASTGQGFTGFNMFSYCGNSPISNKDAYGSNFKNAAHVLSVHAGGGSRYDVVVYYFHPESSKNLDEPPRKNHSSSNSFVAVSSFDELVDAVNGISGYVDDVYIYIHGDEVDWCFYEAQYYSAEDIKDNFAVIDISGAIYLFSCKGGRKNIASALASTTKCTVIASNYKVSFEEKAARCGWISYVSDVLDYGIYSWYSFNPGGEKTPVSFFSISTQ